MKGNLGEVKSGLAHMKGVDISWICRVFSARDKFLVRAILKLSKLCLEGGI